MPRLSPRVTFRLFLPVALLAGVGGWGWLRFAIGQQSSSVSQKSALRVETVRPTRQLLRRIVEVPGQVEAFEVTPIYAKLGGYVRSWSVNIGSKVLKGQVMAELDVPEVVAELEQKRANVDQAKAIRARSLAAAKVAEAQVAASEARLNEAQAGIKRADADFRRWQSEHTRIEQLFRERAQTGSLLDETRMKLQAAESARDEADAHVKTAEAAVSLSRASLDQARADIAVNDAGISIARSDAQRVEALVNYTRIVAPFDGVVTRRNVDTGHLTVPGAQGEPLFIVARSDIVTVSLGVPELFAAEADIGDTVMIRLQAMPGRTLAGKVSRTGYALDSHSRTLRTEVDLLNIDGKLHPGLYAHAIITLDERQNPMTLPLSAIARDGSQSFCMGISDGRVIKLPIVTGLSDGTRAEILSGLTGSENVIKANSPSLVDGQAAQMTEPSNSATPKSKS